MSLMRAGDDNEIIQRLLGLHWMMRNHFEKTVADFGLSPAEARALMELGEPMPMRSMADSLHCDASYVTMLTDRLEEAGLVERGVDPADRRVKQLSPTAEGRRVREALRREIRTSSPALQPLAEADRIELLRILRRVPSAGSCDG